MPADTLPEWANVGYDPDTIRLLGEHDGVSYFLAELPSTRVDGDLCVVAVAEEPIAVGGCSGSRGGGSTSGAGVGSWEFAPGGFIEGDVRDGWVLVHPTLAVRH